MSTTKYLLPDCLIGKCDAAKYAKWLHRKARRHVIRERKRNIRTPCSISHYKAQIHAAVMAGGDRDFYSGEPLDWSLINAFENPEAKTGPQYRKKFWLLPTVDHIVDEADRPTFVICSWGINDAKSDLTPEEFYSLCQKVLRNRDDKFKASFVLT